MMYRLVFLARLLGFVLRVADFRRLAPLCLDSIDFGLIP